MFKGGIVIGVLVADAVQVVVDKVSCGRGDGSVTGGGERGAVGALVSALGLGLGDDMVVIEG